MTVASQAITATDNTPRASDCCGRRPARSPEIFPGIQMSPSLPGKFRNRLVNSRLTGRSLNRTTVSKREEFQEKECQESYANTAHPRKQAKFPPPTASNDLSRSIVECRSPCPQANRPGHRDIARRPGPAITRAASGGHAVRRASCKGGEDFLDRLELVSIGRGRHEDRRRDAGVAPRR